MDALHPRLLVNDFPAAFAFYDAVLPRIAGAVRAHGSAEGPYAHWDVEGEGVLSLFDQAGMAGLAETGGGTGRDRAMLVCRVDDVDAAHEVCLSHGGTLVAAPADRPDWGRGLRTAHLRDPDGNLLELQSYGTAA
ncbi:VOC family protein [Nonomuraea soli]|uniref:Putative enzyme related to lactoylglutathione lyase n=1 Tax=Nonomuraea soli TaxID=1032476 RepID=A0A7W0CF56_9ACTN|nr:VOC family protein [Nonomuraea soli]MBA2889835.1 putative enzyme related to lactoylglutathione lyase [Nonomuraea soli]